MKRGIERLLQVLGACGDALGCNTYPPIVVQERAVPIPYPKHRMRCEVGETIRGITLRSRRATIRVEVVQLGVAYGYDRHNGTGPHGIPFNGIECVLADDPVKTWEDVEVESA